MRGNESITVMSEQDVQLAAAAFKNFCKACNSLDVALQVGQNCWEFFNCGMEKAGPCPAFARSSGRKCWLVAGTLCGSEPEGIMAKNKNTCKECPFYQKIKSGAL
ncbi:MAG: hypothetical protein HQK88_06390 [Nitrospirae bacterium]|nr:hypothetical protein [Nitrospirota bacterium]MBF0534754.1 hypothetical protein [Nitrospirota bacterium]MBF0616428.1 hypothetical protein [Nitrospirota bacterium]